MSNVKTFTYAKKDGTISTRTVFVFAENDNYIRGLDYQYLGKSDIAEIEQKFKNRVPKTVIEFGRGKGEKIDGFNDDWAAAFRTFKKDSIQ